MNLFLVENDYSIDNIFRNSDFFRSGDIIICFNYLAYHKLSNRQSDGNFYFIEDLLSKDDYRMLHNIADYFAENWYKINGEDKTVLEGISYGEITGSCFSRNYFLSMLVKYGEAIRLAKHKWKDISTIYCDFVNTSNYFLYREDDGGKFFNKRKLVELVAHQLGISVFFLKCPRPIPSAHIVKKKAGNSNLKQTIAKGLRNVFHYCTEKVFSIISVLFFHSYRKRKHIYVFSYFNTKSFLLNSAHQVIASGVLLKGIWKSLLKLFFSGLTIVDFKRIKYRYSDSESLFIGKLEKTFLSKNTYKMYDSVFSFNGINYGKIFYPAVQNIVQDIIPSLVYYNGQVKEAIQKYNIGTIIINDEIGEYQRAIIKVCATTKVSSVFVDHGIQAHRHAQKIYDRAESDIVICPGVFYKEYYLQQTRKDRVCPVLGNPSLDIYAGRRREKISRIKNILFLTFEDNFYARLDRVAYQEKYYAEIFPLFNVLLGAGIKIFYKPNSENRQYHEYLFDLFSVDKNNINYVDGETFSAVVYKMDLMVCNVSTCFYEAQAAGVPTIFFEPCFNKEALLPPLSGENGKEVLRASNGEELLKLIEAGISDPTYLNTFLNTFLEKYAVQYIGNVDGNSSKRIMDYVESNGTNS